MTKIQSVCVYCGSSEGSNGAFMKAGYGLGEALATAGLRLVYGGGTKGIMGAVAAGCLDNDGTVTGIIPHFLVAREATAQDIQSLDNLIVTEDMHQRKHLMFDHSDAFVALPGGIGTLEEIVEIMTWAQLGRHHKPIVFANIDGFWDPMLQLMSHMKAEGFVHSQDKLKPLIVDEVTGIIPAIQGMAARMSDAAVGDRSMIDRL